LKAEGQSKAIDTVFQAIHRNDPDPKLLAYQYLQVLPELAKGEGNTFWVIPSEVTTALQSVSKAFTTDANSHPGERSDSQQVAAITAEDASTRSPTGDLGDVVRRIQAAS
jgi:hypothetical protein